MFDVHSPLYIYIHIYADNYIHKESVKKTDKSVEPRVHWWLERIFHILIHLTLISFSSSQPDPFDSPEKCARDTYRYIKQKDRVDIF